MRSSAECVIIGGGVVGTAVAYYLAKRGMRDVVVLERDFLASGATGRCGGGIRQQWSTEPNTRLAIESVRIWKTLEDELDADIEFLQGGYLVLAYTDDDVAQFEKNVGLQRGLGLAVETLSPEEILTEVTPHLNTEGVRMATWCAEDASANPFLTTQAYADAARRLGVEIELWTPACRIIVEGGRVAGVETPRGKISSPFVVNAAGGHSVPLARTAGVELPVTPYRREILVSEPLERFLDPMIISFSYGVYFRQTKHGAVIGGFADPDAPEGFDESSSLAFLVSMTKKLRHLMPILAPVKIVRQWAGLYDVTPDAQPILGATDGVEGLFQANGFSGHGFMIAPKVAELLAQAIAGEEPELDIERLNARRFEGGDFTQDRSVV
ncbi:MAG: FAD-dependent oxidoreductase [Candidatus Eisenbacteria bacterium]|nr:FAD-dependent oxidoreductase [Candidatus Eisenbacteria bacterium]